MIERQYGKIVNIASICAQTGRKVSVDYAASKSAVVGITRALALQVAKDGINVNAIAPGSTATGLIGFKEGDSITSNENGMNRLIMPDEVATLAKLLVSDAGKMIDGEVIHISGGRGTFDIR